MKKFINIAAVTFSLLTAPAIAQTVSQPATTSSPGSTCVGNACDGFGTSINVSAGAGHAGDFRAMWSAGEGGVGSATATKEGGAHSVFGIVYDSCNTGNCGAARVTAEVGGYEVGQSEATATTSKPGQWAIAQNLGIAQTAGMLNVTIRTPTTTHTQNGH